MVSKQLQEKNQRAGAGLICRKKRYTQKYGEHVVQKLQSAAFQNNQWDIDDECGVLLWKEANKLQQLCKEISPTSKEEADKNMLGFQYGDHFVYY